MDVIIYKDFVFLLNSMIQRKPAFSIQLIGGILRGGMGNNATTISLELEASNLMLYIMLPIYFGNSFSNEKCTFYSIFYHHHHGIFILF